MTILIELLKCPSAADSSVEVVERKGLGHPDTICDLLSEELSRALARYYLDNFGSVLHHNVDKSLLVGGRSLPAFAGGQILQPMDLFLSGRATTSVQGKQVPVSEITQAAVEGWLRRNLHAVEPKSHIRIHNLCGQVLRISSTCSSATAIKRSPSPTTHPAGQVSPRSLCWSASSLPSSNS